MFGGLSPPNPPHVATGLLRYATDIHNTFSKQSITFLKSIQFLTCFVSIVTKDSSPVCAAACDKR